MELTRTLRITNDLGLHARAAAKIVELGKNYEASLFFRKGEEQEVDGSSILSIITLSCPKGTEVRARINGKDAETFMETLTQLFENRFGEEK